MIPNTDEFDVFVNEEVMVEIWRGQHTSTARAFGSDWEGQTVYQLWPSVIAQKPQPEMLHISCGVPPAPTVWSALREALKSPVLWACLGWLAGLVVGHWAK